MTIDNHSTLHLIFSATSWQLAKPLVTALDQVLFLQDSVYLLEKDMLCNSESLFARAKDLQARNIHPNPAIEVIDDEQWVQLTTSSHNLISW